MAFDWLFGPRLVELGSELKLRSLVLDQDTVRDVVELVKQETGGARVVARPHRGEAGDGPPLYPPPEFDMSRLATAAEWETSRLIIYGGNERPFHVTLCRNTQPSIFYQPDLRELADEIADLLLSEGRSRPMWRALIPRLPLAAVTALVGCWVWFLLDQQPPLSLSLAGSLLVLLAGVTAWDLQARLRTKVGVIYPGHRIRAMDRQDIRRQRADRHANLLVSAYTVPAGAILGALAVLLLGAY